jgi:hypothetical protein
MIHVLLGFYVRSNDNQRIYHLLKQRSLENDNEYVWFTRNIPDEEIKQQQQQQQDLFPWKFSNRKYPLNENPIYKPV